MTSRNRWKTCACRRQQLEHGGRNSGADLTSDEASEAAVAEAAAAVRRTPPLIPLCLSQLYVRAGKACEGAEFPCWQTAVEGGVAAAAAAPELWCINSCTKSQFEPTLQAQLLISQYVITAVLGLREDAEHKKIYTQVIQCTTPIINAMNELPVYYRYHIRVINTA